ncbi:copper-fist-domain-containing protein [Hymenopellis radicata]|nr:copper-fist-domain-containing protein [Hymenopellis radicata]
MVAAVNDRQHNTFFTSYLDVDRTSRAGRVALAGPAPSLAGELAQRHKSLTMVLISSKKYACETCIKGHRSSACKHTDRPLFEIKKKGRPVTQCEHCRELRKRKQVHVKCICMVKEDAPAASTKKGDFRPLFPYRTAG